MRLLLKNVKYTLNNTLNKLQLGIAAALAYSHSANDTQKIIGIITLTLMATNGLAHIIDASANLEYTVDIFHRIIVRRI